jgi:hypothetical protein
MRTFSGEYFTVLNFSTALGEGVVFAGAQGR